MKSTIDVEVEHVFGPCHVMVTSDVELGVAQDISVQERMQHVFADMAVATNSLIDEIVVQRAKRRMSAHVDGHDEDAHKPTAAKS